GLAPHPDPGIFLIGLEKNDFEGLSSIAAEYRMYAEIIDIATDLGAAATAFDVIPARGGPDEAAPILDAARRSRGVVFAEADLGAGEKDALRAFPYAPPQPPSGLININPDADGTIRAYDYVRGTCRASLALATHLTA